MPCCIQDEKSEWLLAQSTYIYIVPFLLETDHTFQISRTRTVKKIKVTTKTIFFHHQNVSYPQDRKKKTDLPHAASESDQDLSFAI